MIVKAIAFSLAFGILVDAFLVRMTLVPAVMAILGDRAWWVGELYAAIAELAERYRLTLVAVDLLGLLYGETGRSLGVREATVAMRLFRARQLLVGRLAEEAKPTPEGA